MYDTLSLAKNAADVASRSSFNETRMSLREHLAIFIDRLHYVTTDGVPTMPEHIALLRNTQVTLQQLQNGVVVEVGHRQRTVG